MLCFPPADRLIVEATLSRLDALARDEREEQAVRIANNVGKLLGGR